MMLLAVRFFAEMSVLYSRCLGVTHPDPRMSHKVIIRLRMVSVGDKSPPNSVC